MSRAVLTVTIIALLAGGVWTALSAYKEGYQRGFLAGEAIGSLRALPGLSLP